jgi:hypothetical protein
MIPKACTDRQNVGDLIRILVDKNPEKFPCLTQITSTVDMLNIDTIYANNKVLELRRRLMLAIRREKMLQDNLSAALSQQADVFIREWREAK